MDLDLFVALLSVYLFFLLIYLCLYVYDFGKAIDRKMTALTDLSLEIKRNQENMIRNRDSYSLPDIYHEHD